MEAIRPILLKYIADTRMLRTAWDHLASHDDTAPGPDGLRYDDLDDTEVWSFLRAISSDILAGDYRVGEDRLVMVPKDRTDPSRGCRPISLLNIGDRVVHRACVEVLQPLLDPILGRNVLGFRPRRGRLHALALAEREAVMGNRYVVVAEDIRDAFTMVPINRLLDVLAVYVPSDQVLQLLRAAIDTDQPDGLRQGSPLSPLLLNVYLHHVCDQPWRKMWPTVPMIRVADDLLLLCRSAREAKTAWDALRTMLSSASMPLKGSPKSSVRDLRKGGSVQWLGFAIHKGDEKLRVKIAEKAWGRLEEALVLVHEKPDTPVRAVQSINGWVEAMAPCYRFTNVPCAYRRLKAMAAKQGFDEIPSEVAIRSRWRRVHKKWCTLREEIFKRPAALDSPYSLTTAAPSRPNGDIDTGDRSGSEVAPWE